MPAIERVSEHVWRVELPCATLPPYDHVNAYVIAQGGVAVVVDPGSDEPKAQALLQSALTQADARLVKAVALTHTHPDHTGGVQQLLDYEAVRNGDPPPVLVHAAEASNVTAWSTTYLADGRVVTVGDVTVTALHTPGHSQGHLSFLVTGPAGGAPEAAIVGDLAVATGSVWVGLPEGDVEAYLTTLVRLEHTNAPVLAPGHGPLITNPAERLRELAGHRLEREAQVLGALTKGSATAAEITRRVYPGYPEAVLALAEQSVLAHIVKLMRELKVVHLGDDEQGPFALRR